MTRDTVLTRKVSFVRCLQLCQESLTLWLIVVVMIGPSCSSSSSTDSATSSPALSSNPALGIDPHDDHSPPSTLAWSGRVTPPATTIPRFRKYTVEDFQFLKMLGKGSFGKVNSKNYTYINICLFVFIL
jgi:hypothetical protein